MGNKWDSLEDSSGDLFRILSEVLFRTPQVFLRLHQEILLGALPPEVLSGIASGIISGIPTGILQEFILRFN